MWTLCGGRCILDGTMIESVMHITRSDFDCIEPLLSRQSNWILQSGFSHPPWIISSPTMLHFSLYCKLSPCLKRLQVHSRIKITHVHFKRTWAEPNFGIILVDIMDYYNLHLTSRVASYQCFNENVGSFNWGKRSQMQNARFWEREREISQPPWIISTPCCVQSLLWSPCLKGFKCTQELRSLTWAGPNFGIILVDMDYQKLHLSSRVASYQCFNANMGSFNGGKCSQMQMCALARERDAALTTLCWRQFFKTTDILRGT